MIGKDGSREEVLRKYDAWLTAHPEVVRKAKQELWGKRLGCWCAPKACHGELLVAAMAKLEAKDGDASKVGSPATGFGKATSRAPGGGAVPFKGIGALKPRR